MIAFALSGLDVALVLTIGILVNAVIGFAGGSFGWSGFMESVGNGISSMGDLIIVTMLAGGMLELIRINGGLDFIVEGLTRRIKGNRGAEFSIAALVALANLCTANNTIAIITSGQIARDITQKFKLDPRKTASILDTFSCIFQGVIPYGAQMLVAISCAAEMGVIVSAFEVLPCLFYPMFLAVSSLIAIFLFKAK